MSPEDRTTIDLICHGEPVGGICFRGHQDDPLSPKGRKQMDDTTGTYSDWNLVITSPLLRCFGFARETATTTKLLLKIEAQFRELDYGSWEGRTADEIRKHHPGTLEDFFRNPIKYPPGGSESLIAFQVRILAAWKNTLSKHHGNRILLICHGGTIRMVLALLLHIPLEKLFQITVPNAGLTRITQYSKDTD
jgi:broad specificity phosphatase PhoE